MTSIRRSSLLIDAERRKVLPLLQAYLSSTSRTIAPIVYEETVTEPKSIGYYATSASRIEKLYGKCITIEEPEYSEPLVFQRL